MKLHLRRLMLTAVVLGQSLSSHGFVSKTHSEVFTVGMVGASLAGSEFKIRSLQKELNELSQKLQGEINSKQAQADALKTEAKAAQASGMQNHSKARIFSSDAANRLRPAGVDQLVKGLQADPQLSHNNKITITYTESLGGNEKGGVKTQVKEVKGTLDQISSKLKDAIKNNAKIVQMDLKWQSMAGPNPGLGASLMGESARLRGEANHLRSDKRALVNAEKADMQKTIKRIRWYQAGNIAVLVTLIGYYIIRELSAAEMVAMETSCVNPHFMRAKATGVALGRDHMANEADFLEVEMQMEEACLAMSSI